MNVKETLTEVFQDVFDDDELEMIFEEKKLELCIVCFCIVDLSLFEFFIFSFSSCPIPSKFSACKLLEAVL